VTLVVIWAAAVCAGSSPPSSHAGGLAGATASAPERIHAVTGLLQATASRRTQWL